MTQDGRRQVGIGRIGVGSVTVVTMDGGLHSPSSLILCPNLNPLIPSRLSNALPNTLTSLRLVNAFPTRRTFDLSSPSRQVDSRHPHPFPTQCSFNLSSSSRQVDSRHPHSFLTRRLSTFTPLHQVYFRRSIGLATAVRQSPIVYLPRSMHHSLSCLALYIYVPLRSSVTSLATLCSFSMPHPQFPISVYSCFIYLYSYLRRPYFSYSVHFLRPIPDRPDHPNHYHTPHLYKYTKYKML